MTEESLREIIGIAKKSKWNRIQKYIKNILQKTLKKERGYDLTALEVSIKGEKKSKFNTIIKGKEDFDKIDKINDFNHLSLYQTTQNSNNLIDISQNDGTIIILAKYLGPELGNLETFDFSVHLDAFNEPFFTTGSGDKFNSSEILKLINNKGNIKTKDRLEKTKKKPVSKKEIDLEDFEALVFRKLTNKNPVWNGSETKSFHTWKAKIKNKYRIETGKISHYKEKPTKQFSLYLKNLVHEKPKKGNNSKLRNNKKIPQSRKNSTQISEEIIFNNLTGRNAIWNGSKTKNFIIWKEKTYKKYRKKTGKNPLYGGKLTQNFKNYLKSLITSK